MFVDNRIMAEMIYWRERTNPVKAKSPLRFAEGNLDAV
jgi:hypothetical protein